MHVRFTAPFDYTPTLRTQVTIAYREGWSGSVKAECGKRAIAQNKAVRIASPARLAQAANAGS